MNRFSDLISPLTPADISGLWLNRELKLQTCAAGKQLTPLLDWETLWKLIERGVIPIDDVRVMYGRRRVAPKLYVDDGILNVPKLKGLIAQRVSIIANNLHRHVSVILVTCQDAAAAGIQIQAAGAVVTIKDGGALPLHYDDYDIIVLQMAGTKRWRVYDSGAVAESKGHLAQTPPQTPPMLDVILHPGDLTYLPAGLWHECENGPQLSLHVGLLLVRSDGDPFNIGTS
jgi:quercetin dioxygenase-like cupin family protein